MKEAPSPPPLKWAQRLFNFFKCPKNAPGTAANPVGASRVSSSVLSSARRALQWIMIIPGSARIMANMNVALDIIDGFNAKSAQDERVRRRLEHYVQYLVELLEPFHIMRRHEVSSVLQSQMLTLGRELHDVSVKFKAIQLSDEGSPRCRSFFFKQKRLIEYESNARGMSAFTQDFGFALDRYRETALPMYPVAPIEVALHPLGIMSHSSCGFEPFLNGILDFEQIMEYRIGVVRTIEFYSNYNRSPYRRYLIVQFVNGRGFENWTLTSGVVCRLKDRASVSFATTKEALTRNSTWMNIAPIVEDTLSVTRLARQFKILSDLVSSVEGKLYQKVILFLLGHVLPDPWTPDEDLLVPHFLRSHPLLAALLPDPHT